MNELEFEYDQSHEADPDLHPFELHPQLAEDTIPLGEFPLCRLLLMNDANYPWFILVPRRVGVSEIFHLSFADQQQLMRESSYLAENLCDQFGAHKMNVAALGNVVSQLHVHHIVRYNDDLAWPAPVWGRHPAKPYQAAEVAALHERLAMLLSGVADL